MPPKCQRIPLSSQSPLSECCFDDVASDMFSIKGLNEYYFELIVHNQRFICDVLEGNMIIIVS